LCSARNRSAARFGTRGRCRARGAGSRGAPQVVRHRCVVRHSRGRGRGRGRGRSRGRGSQSRSWSRSWFAVAVAVAVAVDGRIPGTEELAAVPFSRVIARPGSRQASSHSTRGHSGRRTRCPRE
jgi:hypothetical protein